MAIVFRVHNEFGNLWDEKIYREEIVGRCAKTGLCVQQEVPIRVSHGDFVKIYLMDWVVDNSIVYELKTAEAFSADHRKQILNYLFLSRCCWGKLVNMRSPSVTSEFIASSFTPEERRQFEVHADDWRDLNPDSHWLRQLIMDLLQDWGTLLDLQLFYDAIAYFRGGEDCLIKPIPVLCNGQFLSTQKGPLLTPDIAVRLSAVKNDVKHPNSVRSYESHLRRFLSHTTLQAIHWINFNRQEISMKTIMRQS